MISISYWIPYSFILSGIFRVPLSLSLFISFFICWYLNREGIPHGSVVKNLPAGATRETGSILCREDPLEKEVATHSSILAWRILRTEESGRLQSLGSQRFRRDWSNWIHTHGNRTIWMDSGDGIASLRALRWCHADLIYFFLALWGLIGGSDGKESTCNAGDLGSIPGLGRSPGEGDCMAIHSSILSWRIPMDRGASWAAVHGVAKSWA